MLHRCIFYHCVARVAGEVRLLAGLYAYVVAPVVDITLAAKYPTGLPLQLGALT